MNMSKDELLRYLVEGWIDRLTPPPLAEPRELADWLLGRIAEDEHAARSVLGDPGIDGLLTTGEGPIADHVARWDPERVLAECQAKRLIVEGFREADELADDAPAHSADAAVVGAWESVLRLLALPYADRPAYRTEWRP